MKLLTFLGTTNYTPVTYVDGEFRWLTQFFQEFAARRYKPDEIIIFLTKEARENANWAKLRPILDGLARDVRPVDIPSGKSEDELWELFDIIVSQFADEEEAILDVTNALRSLPILNMFLAAFVRIVKSVTISHILYGAFDAKDEAGEVPVFDLKPFLTLLDWTAASKTFLDTGDARQLGRLAEDRHGWLWRNIPDKESLPRKLSSLGRQLVSISDSFETIRPDEFIRSVASMHGLVDEVELEAGRWLKPLGQLLHRIQGDFFPFRNPKWTLAAERDLVKWYHERGHIAQAVALMREWLVSWVMRAAGRPVESLCDMSLREKAGNFLGGIVNKRKQPIKGAPSAADHEFDAPLIAERLKELADLFNRVSKMRNDVMHCGKREQPESPKVILEHCKNCLDRILELPIPQED